MDTTAVVAMIVGVLLIFWRNKRKYDRTNEYGIDRLPTYVGALLAKTFDLLLLMTGGVLLVSGATYVLSESANHWWILLAFPVLIWLLFLS